MYTTGETVQEIKTMEALQEVSRVICENEITKRDLFAALAMQGLVAQGWSTSPLIAQKSFEIADSMLEGSVKK